MELGCFGLEAGTEWFEKGSRIMATISRLFQTTQRYQPLAEGKQEGTKGSKGLLLGSPILFFEVSSGVVRCSMSAILGLGIEYV